MLTSAHATKRRQVLAGFLLWLLAHPLRWCEPHETVWRALLEGVTDSLPPLKPRRMWVAFPFRVPVAKGAVKADKPH